MDQASFDRLGLRVTVLTTTLRANGHLSAYPFRRLTDALNLGTDQYVRLNEATITTSLWTPGGKRHPNGVAIVNKNDIVMAFPALHDMSRDDVLYVRKQAFPVLIYTPIVRISGLLHQTADRDATDLLTMRQRFVPVTNATVMALQGSDKPLFELPFLNVQVSYISCILEEAAEDDGEGPKSA